MKRGNLFWGLIFVFAALVLLLGQFTPFAAVLSGIGIFNLLLTMLLIYWFAISLPRMEYFGIFMPIALFVVIYSDVLHLDAITPWPVLGAAIFLSIGMNMILPRKRYFHKHSDQFNEDGTTIEHLNRDVIHCQSSFSGSSKYIDTDQFREGYFRCNFGSLKVYFDQARIIDPKAVIDLDLSFGEIQLYLPRDWNCDIQIHSFAGEVNENHRPATTNGPTVVIKGNISFGECKIFYI